MKTIIRTWKSGIVEFDTDDILYIRRCRQNDYYIYYTNKEKYNFDTEPWRYLVINCYHPIVQEFRKREIREDMKGPYFNYTKVVQSVVDEIALPMFKYWNDEEGENYYYINTKHLLRLYILTEKKETTEYGYYCPVYVFEFNNGTRLINRVDHTKTLPDEIEKFMVKKL